MDPETLREQLHTLGTSTATQKHKAESAPISTDNPQIIYSWEAPVRAYKRKPAGVMRFYAAIAILLSFIVFFFKEYILVIPIWSVMFLGYVLTITPPHIIRHDITKFGVRFANRTYLWQELSHFYFVRKFDYILLVLFDHNPYHAPLYVVLPDKATYSKVFEILLEHIVYVEEPEKSLTDRLAEWLTTLMPEEESQAELSTPQEKPL